MWLSKKTIMSLLMIFNCFSCSLSACRCIQQCNNRKKCKKAICLRGNWRKIVKEWEPHVHIHTLLRLSPSQECAVINFNFYEEYYFFKEHFRHRRFVGNFFFVCFQEVLSEKKNMNEIFKRFSLKKIVWVPKKFIDHQTF